MDALEKWMEKNKKLCVATGIFGLLVSPFLWPFFLAILFQSLSLMVPVLLVWLLIKQPWMGKEETDEKIYKNVQRGTEANTGKMSSDDTRTDDIPTNNIPESRTEKGAEPVKGSGEKTAVPDEEGCIAILWYKSEGRERFFRLKAQLEKEGKTEFSVSRDGICTVRQTKGFQRVGVLRGYPGKQILSAQAELNKDGFTIKQSGDYAWISWKKGGMAHAL